MLRIIFILLFFLSHALCGKQRQVSLQKALENKLVTASANGLGSYQGYCIKLNLKNLTKDSLIVFVEAGRRLNSLNDAEQDILIVKQQIIAMKSGELKHVVLKGYCCQASKRAPSEGAKYNLNKLADTNLVKVARFLNSNEFEKDAEQDAVWAISDGHSAANIASENDSLTQSLREMVAYIKGEELPWYRILSQKYVYSNGVISSIALKLQGLVSISCEQDNYVTLFVKDEWGMQVAMVKSEWAKAGLNKIYKIDLPIKGLAKGRYSLEIVSPEKILAHRVFEI